MKRSFREAALLAPVALFVALFALLPVAVLFASSIGALGGLGGISSLFSSHNPDGVLNQRSVTDSLVQGGLSAVLAVALGYPAGVFLGRYSWPGREVTRSLLLVPFLLPSLIVVLAIEDLFGPGGTLSHALSWIRVAGQRHSGDRRGQSRLQCPPGRPPYGRGLRDRIARARGDGPDARRQSGAGVPRWMGAPHVGRRGRGRFADVPVLGPLVRSPAPAVRDAVLHGRSPDLVARPGVARTGRSRRPRIRHGRVVPRADPRLPRPRTSTVLAGRTEGSTGASPLMELGELRPRRGDDGRGRRRGDDVGRGPVSHVGPVRGAWVGRGVVDALRSVHGQSGRDRGSGRRPRTPCCSL